MLFNILKKIQYIENDTEYDSNMINQLIQV